MKPRGRPRVDAGDVSQIVTVTLPRKTFDRICAAALRKDVSVPAMIRKAVELTFKKSTGRRPSR